MAKFVHDDVLDGMFRRSFLTGSNANKMYVCTAQPSTLVQARAYSLASTALDSTDFTLANGDTNGRKMTVAQQSNLSIGTTGTATHVGVCSTSQTKVLLVTTCTAQLLTSGGTVTVPAFDDELADAS